MNLVNSLIDLLLGDLSREFSLLKQRKPGYRKRIVRGNHIMSILTYLRGKWISRALEACEDYLDSLKKEEAEADFILQHVRKKLKEAMQKKKIISHRVLRRNEKRDEIVNVLKLTACYTSATHWEYLYQHKTYGLVKISIRHLPLREHSFIEVYATESFDLLFSAKDLTSLLKKLFELQKA